MNQIEAISALSKEWDRPNGFFAKLRAGEFDSQHGDKIAETVRNIDLGDSASIDRRLVSLLWYLPAFCEWQTERIDQQGGDMAKYELFRTHLMNTLEQLLGVP